MANVAVFPSATSPLTLTVNGRTYTSTIGAAPLVVPDFDAFLLLSNGWLASTKGFAAGMNAVGATGARPVANPALDIPAPPAGFQYLDTTLGAVVTWNGTAWINNSSGASV